MNACSRNCHSLTVRKLLHGTPIDHHFIKNNLFIIIPIAGMPLLPEFWNDKKASIHIDQMEWKT